MHRKIQKFMTLANAVNKLSQLFSNFSISYETDKMIRDHVSYLNPSIITYLDIITFVYHLTLDMSKGLVSILEDISATSGTPFVSGM